MTLISKTLIGLLEIEDPFVNRIRILILKSFDDTEKFDAVLSRQCENRGTSHCFSCDNEGICLFLSGVLQFKRKKYHDAIQEIENAGQHFRGRDETWNDIIGRTMLGSVYEADGNSHAALRNYKKALEALDYYIRVHPTEYMEKAAILKKLLQDRTEACSPDKKKTPAPPPARNTARITMPWMPRYGGLYASPHGPTFIESFPREGDAAIHGIILDDVPHQIFSLKPGDNLITLVKDKKYGWAKVSGNSMNAARPVSIKEGDFVLYYESRDANHGAIVVAYCPDESGSGYRLVVKRFSKTDRLLISESEPPGRYDPMPLNKDTQIVGTVIAVAKPAGN